MPDNARKGNRLVHTTKVVALTILVWATLAYLVAPSAWRIYEDLALPKTSSLRTRTTAGIPGDALNIALIGSAPDLAAAMAAACWLRADPLSWKSALRLGFSVAAGRPYPAAPVSPLRYLGRAEDMAFERQIGANPDRRHHVRFWQVPSPGSAGPSVWLGAATEDVSVGLNHLTGQFTHHISPDIDAERGAVMTDLAAAGAIGPVTTIPGSGAATGGRNGEHDLFFTDGLILVARITPAPNENGTRAGCRS